MTVENRFTAFCVLNRFFFEKVLSIFYIPFTVFECSAKLERQSDELRQMEHEVEQTKASCDNIIQQHEKQEQETFTRSRSNSSSAVIKELEMKVVKS